MNVKNSSLIITKRLKIECVISEPREEERENIENSSNRRKVRRTKSKYTRKHKKITEISKNVSVITINRNRFYLMTKTDYLII